MRFTTVAFTALVASTSVSAQLAGLLPTSPIALAEEALGLLSPSCQATVLSLLNSSSPLYTCVNVADLVPILMTNGSILPPLDAYIGDVCTNAPCTNATLSSAAAMIIAGCSSDLATYGVSNTTVTEVFELYPLAREVACLKTDMPFNTTNASIPITSSSYNLTNGTFCVTSVLTELSSYVGNITNALIDTAIVDAVIGTPNKTELSLIEMIPPSMLCYDCVFAALDLIGQEIPAVGNISLGNGTTLMSVVDGTCNATGLVYTTNGTLPSSIVEVAANSTYPFNVTAGNVTYPAAVPAMKKRWIGQL